MKATAVLMSVSGPSIEETPRERGTRIQELETVTALAAPYYNAAFHYRWKKNGGEKRATLQGDKWWWETSGH